MLIRQFIFGPIETNCYVVACEKTGEAMVIDPDIRTKKEKDRFQNEIGGHKLKLKYIINTHHHSDHTGGNRMIKEMTGAQILIHERDAAVLSEPWKWWSKMAGSVPPHPCPVCGSDGSNIKIGVHEDLGKAIMNCGTCGMKFEIIASPRADRLLHHDDLINFGSLEFKVIHTPGHTPGGICIYSGKEHVIFTGDTLFSGSVGRTDTIDGSYDDIIKSAKGLMRLPDDTAVYPGHGPATTIGEEKRNNPFVQN